jgi:hypothetical protein
VNEGGIGEEISQRLRALNMANNIEQNNGVYDIQPDFNPDEYDNDAYIIDGEEDEFDPGGEK